MTEHVREAETINGVVTDPSGAVVPGAAVTLMGSNRVISATRSGPTGRYTLHAEPGSYRLVVEAKGFAKFESDPVHLEQWSGREERTLDVRLKIALLVDVEVPEDSALDGDRSGMAVALNAREIEQMPMDSKALLEELQGIAGSANAQVIVDGFSGSKLPPRNSIREVRINQNPYSAENDTDTISGVIEVLFKPGTNDLHGEIYLYGTDSALNAGNPLSRNQPPYYSFGSTAAVSGSAGSRVSYYTYVDQTQQKTTSAVNAETVDASSNETAAMYAVANPRSTVNVLGRADVRAGNDSSASFRYTLEGVTQNNQGVGQLMLATQGLNSASLQHTVQVAISQGWQSRIANEARLQYIRTRTTQTPVSIEPTIVVEGAFIGGGNDQGFSDDHQDKYEVSDSLSIAKERHYLQIGGRVRIGRDASVSQANYNGKFIFSTLAAYETTLRGMAAGQAPVQINAAGGGASQYSVTTGSPEASVLVQDTAAFAQDSWQVRDDFKLSYGLRFEAQTYIPDHADLTPRVGFSWGIGNHGKSGAGPRYVLHGGGGIFYQRFTTDPALKVTRQDGVTQQEFVVQSPQFCPPGPVVSAGCGTAPPTAKLGMQSAAAVYRVSPQYRAPYFIEASLGLNRQLGRFGSIGVTYVNSRGAHTQYLENANAPLPGTYNPANPWTGSRPEGTTRNIYEYTSEGVSRTNMVTANFSLRSRRLQGYATYTLRFGKSDAESDGTFPLNTYDMRSDYGRSNQDIRHSLTLGERVDLPFAIRSLVYFRAASGAPFNIVVGQDLNGDTQYNDRPAFATDLTRLSVVATRWGVFDTAPTAVQMTIPRNYGQGPGLLSMDLGLTRSIAVGPLKPAATAGAPAERKYTLEILVQAMNLLNHPNYAPPVAVVNSPLFGRSVGLVGGTSLSPDRLVDMQLSMRF